MADGGKVSWCYMWSPSLGGGGGGCSLSLCCMAGASACTKESVERVLMRRGARRRRLLGVHGSLTCARSEGATMPLSCSASASHGGICIWSLGSRSGMKAGFSIPPGWRENTELAQLSRSETLFEYLKPQNKIKAHFTKSSEENSHSSRFLFFSRIFTLYQTLKFGTPT